MFKLCVTMDGISESSVPETSKSVFTRRSRVSFIYTLMRDIQYIQSSFRFVNGFNHIFGLFFELYN